MKSTRTSWFAASLGWLCFAGGVLPFFSNTETTTPTKSESGPKAAIAKGTQTVKETRITLGLPFSPFFTYVNTTEQTNQPAVITKPDGTTESTKITNTTYNQHWDGRFEFVSWSALLLVVGIVLLCLARFLKPPATATPVVGQLAR